jgi:PAS domain S-box-containing protein
MDLTGLQILVLEDEAAHAEAIRRALKNNGMAGADIRIAGTMREYMEYVASLTPDIALVDMNLPDGRAVDILTVPPEDGSFPILIMTSYGDEQTAVEALKSGALDYLIKSPEAFAAMPITLTRVLREWDLLQERKRVAEMMQAAEVRFRSYFELGLIGLAETSPEKGWIRVNDALCSMLGYSEEELLHTTWEKLTYPEDLPADLAQFERMFSGDQDGYTLGKRFVRKDGAIVHTILSVRCIRRPDRSIDYMVASLQDITNFKHLEEQLLHSQKMEAVGQLAGGVAHDLNNILTVIYGYCSVLQMKIGKEAPFRSDIDQIYAAAERAANLTRSLLAFSRKQIMSPKTINLNEVVTNVVKLLSRIIGEDIELITVLTETPLNIFADRGQVEQVLMNLAANARDAMPDGGKLTIETKIEDIDEGFIQSHGYGTAGEFIVISVSDTGKGMDAETSYRIFEPFFTTKEVGQGTGLGLSIVYGVVKQHNGYINVSSKAGHGTTFNIYLPRVYEEGVDDVDKPESDYPLKGNETLLVAEDDPSIREFAQLILRKYGYKVILAQDGADAVEKFKANIDKIDIIILDMIMPGKSGREAYEEIRKVRSDVKVLFMSGYSPDLLQNKGFLDTGEEVLIKPVLPLELIRKIRAALDR